MTRFRLLLVALAALAICLAAVPGHSRAACTTVAGVDSALIQGNVNNNLGVDFSILLKNYTGALTAGDFVL